MGIPRTIVRSLWLGLLAANMAGAAEAPPNIVIILCDDLGYGDVRSLNPDGKIPTPNLDRLAEEGMTFRDAHSGSAVCSPTRYGLLTGRYAWRSRLQQGVLGGLSPRLIEQGRLTVASLLQASGYHTACFGKWHLGLDWVKLTGKRVTELGIESSEQVWNVDFTRPFSNGPLSLGFDDFFGISASLDMVPYTFLQGDRVVANPIVEKSFAMTLGRPGRQTRKGPAAPDFDAADVLPAVAQRAADYIAGRGPEARDGRPFFLYLPFSAPHTPVLPTAEWQGRSGLNPYADFVMQTDAAIGQVLEALDQQGLAQNTLVIAASDNGCSPEAGFDELLKQGHNPSHVFRGHKADLYEGGHRVPLIVRWPARVHPGAVSDRLTCLTDVLATCAEVASADVPPTAAEDSVSFLPALMGEPEQGPARAVVHHSINGSFAIRQANWKLLLCADSGGWSAPRPGSEEAQGLPAVQLYDLQSDIGERQNAQDQHPEVVKRLTALLEQFVAEGRSTPGETQQNAVAVDIWRGVEAARRPSK